MSLQYLKKEVTDEVDFLRADKYQSFLKVYSNPLGIKVSYKVDIIIDGYDQVFSKYSKQQVYNIFTISQKGVRNGSQFWHADKRQSFYKLVLSFLMGVARHVQNTQNRKFANIFAIY